MNSCLTDGCRVGASQTFFIQIFHVLNITVQRRHSVYATAEKKKNENTYGAQNVYELSHGKL